MKQFKNRVFGAAIVKAINSNYNADFSGQPRTLPNGKVYATDKAFKYTIKNYLKDIYNGEKLFYFKKLKETFNPMSLDEKFEDSFPDDKETKDKKIIAKRLLSCIDVRLFGATYANKIKKVSVSIHGPVQINHGVNIWFENNIYSEQITAPFGDPKKSKNSNGDEDKFDEAAMTTIGRQSKLEEGHYLHHFSVNPNNLKDVIELTGEDGDNLSDEDINKLKEAMRRGATYYDSAAKAGTENELMIWVQLKDTSRIVLPNFTQLIKMNEKKEDGKVVADLSLLTEQLDAVKDDISIIEIYYNKASIRVMNEPQNTKKYSL